jgi:glutathione S-transferase
LIDCCARHYRLLDAQLREQTFLTGAQISLADVAAGASLYRYFNLDIDRPRVSNVEAWYRRLTARAAYREHVMIQFDDLRGRMHP